MVEERRALRAFEAHLEEVIGVEEAKAVVDGLDRHVTRDDLDQAVEETRDHIRQAIEHQTDRLAARWRRDLLLVTGAQFFALAGAVAALTALG